MAQLYNQMYNDNNNKNQYDGKYYVAQYYSMQFNICGGRRSLWLRSGHTIAISTLVAVIRLSRGSSHRFVADLAGHRVGHNAHFRS